jgi:DNA sulfur modification protein DndC
MQVPQRVKTREANKRTLFDAGAGTGTGYKDALLGSIESLKMYAALYPHWIVTYSGGKDSSASLAFVLSCLERGIIRQPESLTVLYADTRMELPPLHTTAMKTLEAVRQRGFNTQVVQPRYNERYWVNLLGRGLPPPRLQSRWCTRTLKQQPMERAALSLQKKHGENKVLFLTGVRMGESQARDDRIIASCSMDDAECGQGWFQQKKHSLAPLLDWRVCWVWRWLYSDDNPLPVVREIEPIYAADDVVDIRTGCIGCYIVAYDWALHYLVKIPEWSHLAPFLKLKPLYDEMREAKYRLRRGLFEKKSGGYSASKSNSLGPLTIEARQTFFERIRELEKEAGYQLINDREETLIRRMWKWCFYPQGWTGAEQKGTDPIAKPLFTKPIKEGKKIKVQAQLIGWQPLLL